MKQGETRYYKLGRSIYELSRTRNRRGKHYFMYQKLNGNYAKAVFLPLSRVRFILEGNDITSRIKRVTANNQVFFK